jgi:hypothetical protein
MQIMCEVEYTAPAIKTRALHLPLVRERTGTSRGL